MGQSISVPDGGISYDAFLAYTASMNIPTEFVDVKATFERYRETNSNLISKEKVAELKLKTDVFLTHDWGIDELGQANHERVAAINKELKSLGFVTWFDSSGINNSSVIIVFVTQRYMNKVNGSDANDNCRKEFKYAAQKKSSTQMIPVVMEPRMKDIRGTWDGLMQMELGNILYVDFSNDNDFQSAIQQLKAEILSRTNPLWVLRTRRLTPVSEGTTSPPPPGSVKAIEADLLMSELEKDLENAIEGVLAPYGAFAVFIIKAKVVEAVQKYNGKRQENQKKEVENDILQQEMAGNKIRLRILKEQLKREKLKTQYLERKVAGRTTRSQKEQRQSRQDQTRHFRTQHCDTGSETSSNEPDDFQLTQDIRDQFGVLSEETCNIPRTDIIAVQGSIIIVVKDYNKYLSSNEEKVKFVDFSIDYFESKGAFGKSLELTVEEFTNPDDVLTCFSNYYFNASAAFQFMRDREKIDEDQLTELTVESEHITILLACQCDEPDILYSSIQTILLQYEKQILRSSLFFSFQSKTFFVLLSVREQMEIEEFLNVFTIKSNSFVLAAEINQELFTSFFDPVSLLKIVFIRVELPF
jgi:hypothetical protein